MHLSSSLLVCVVLHYMVNVGGVAIVTCPSGAEAQGNYCFIASKQATEFAKAYMFCEAYGCKLAVPNDTEIQTALSTYAQANDITVGNIIFGCSDVIKEGTWMCYGDHVDVSELTWASSEPSGGIGDNCLTTTSFSTWEMADTSCGNNNKYICNCPATTMVYG